MEDQITLPHMLSVAEVASLLGLLESEARHVMPYSYRFGPRTIRYNADDVRSLWHQFRNDGTFDGALKRVLERRNPQPAPKMETKKRGRYTIPSFPFTGRVYFIEGNGLIKIGFARKPLKRLNSLKTGTPFRIRLVASMRGSIQLERHLHERFADLREHGEWFRDSPRLRRFINEAASWKH